MVNTIAVTLITRSRAAVTPSESVTLAVKAFWPPWVGVPVIAPVEEFSARPAGKLPVVEKVYGGVPPVAEIFWFAA